MTDASRLLRAVLVACALCGVAPGLAKEPAPMATITPDALAARQATAGADVVVLDVRTPDEYAAGHVPGARNVPHDQVASRLAELRALRDREVVVYCRTGRRAALALAHLQKAGFTKLAYLAGDMPGWTAGNRPVEQGGTAR